SLNACRSRCASGSSLATRNKTAIRRTEGAGCCAREASGHTAATPPRRVMNSRRLIASPEAWDWRAYEPKVTRLAGKHRSSSGWPMSALGQKQTYAVQKPMSALPPIATAKADFRKRSCLLYPRKRTCAVRLAMSALGQKRTHATQQLQHQAERLLQRP